MSEVIPLHLVQLSVSTPALFELAKRRRLPTRDTDVDYLVHCFTGELFGDAAPKPFRVVGQRGRYTELLGYSSVGSDELARHARQFAEPIVHAGCDWRRFASKTMPSEWRVGARLGFEVRACPIVRVGRNHSTLAHGAEVDIYLSRLKGGDEDAIVDREAIYCEWLKGELLRHPGADLLEARMCAFQLGKVMRRTSGATRTSRLSQRPDVLLRGEIRVARSEEFVSLLRRGVGRHRSFGYGMLLLRPRAM